MALKYKALEEIRPVLTARGGIELEDVLWIFKRPQDALIAVMEMKETIALYNRTHKGLGNEIGISGYGIHSGNMKWTNSL